MKLYLIRNEPLVCEHTVNRLYMISAPLYAFIRFAFGRNDTSDIHIVEQLIWRRPPTLLPRPSPLSVHNHPHSQALRSFNNVGLQTMALSRDQKLALREDPFTFG